MAFDSNSVFYSKNSDWSSAEEDAHCSEAPYEDALIPSRGRILLFIQQRKISAYQVNLTRETDRVETTVAIHYGSPNLSPNKTRPTIIVCSARQRYLGLHIVVHGYSSSP